MAALPSSTDLLRAHAEAVRVTDAHHSLVRRNTVRVPSGRVRVDGRCDLRAVFYDPYFALHPHTPALLMATVHDNSSTRAGGRIFVGRSRLICGMDAGESKSS